MAALVALNQRQAVLAGVTARLQRLSPAGRLRSDRQRLDDQAGRLERAVQAVVELRRARLETLAGRLAALNPLAVLQRGYALVQTPQGQVVRSTAQLAPGEEIRVQLADGQADARVEKIIPA